MAFAAACKKYFDKKPGQTMGEFVAELRELSHESKVEMAKELSVHFGEEVTVPAPTA